MFILDREPMKLDRMAYAGFLARGHSLPLRSWRACRDELQGSARIWEVQRGWVPGTPSLRLVGNSDTKAPAVYTVGQRKTLDHLST